MQEQPNDRDNDEGIALDEASSSGHVVNAYQCSQAMQRQTPRSNPQDKLTVTILGVKGLPLRSGKYKKI